MNSIRKSGKPMVCYHCGCDVKVYRRKGVLSHNAATIDHLYSKFSLIRLLIGNLEHRVLSCYSCNQKRNTAENLVVQPKEKGKVDIIEMLKQMPLHGAH